MEKIFNVLVNYIKNCKQIKENIKKLHKALSIIDKNEDSNMDYNEIIKECKN